jgi:hypothetical protein
MDCNSGTEDPPVETYQWLSREVDKHPAMRRYITEELKLSV